MLNKLIEHSFVFHPWALGPPLTAPPGARSKYVQQGYDRSLEVQRPRTRTACFSGYVYTHVTSSFYRKQTSYFYFSHDIIVLCRILGTIER